MDTPEDLVVTLEGAVERLKVIFSETKSPLTDNVSEVTQFCITLEGVLRHQQKERVSFWGERRDYWSYLNEGVGGMRTLGSITKQVQVLPQLTTGQGRGRALIRECLSEHLLADCVQNSISNTKRTKEWYCSGAILLSAPLSQRVISALYDLSNVDFDLPVEGIDLDEMWPSFVLKSFQSPRHKSLFGVLGSTKEAMVAEKKKYYQRSILERAVEEQPTEVFVKQEIPFDLELVGTLLDEIRNSLIGGNSSTHHSFLPELRVTKMDDITSCLTVLRDYVASISCDVTKTGNMFQLELKRSRDQITDLELQLQETILESESSEGGLLAQLQDTRSELKTCSEELQHLSEENASLVRQLSETRQQVSALETLNFSLEEQLMETASGDGEGGEGGGSGERRRKRGYTLSLLENGLAEKDKEIATLTSLLQEKEVEIVSLHTQVEEAEASLQEIANQLQLLEEHVAAETESKEQAVQHALELEKSRDELSEIHQQCLQVMEELRSQLRSSQESEVDLKSQLESQKSTLNSALEELKNTMERQLQELTCQLESESILRRTLEQERNMAKEELQSMHGLVENETASYRFQLSSQSMELQQAKEVIKEKEKMISELCRKVSELESNLGAAQERRASAESQLEELRQELQDVESVLHSNHDEMTSLNEQLAENTLSRDQERAQMLKLQNELDVVQMSLKTEKQELSRQVKRLTEENDDIRRAFKKLLEQKVTLWQHADELEQEQVALGTWIDDKTVTGCMGCGAAFSIFNRKHHCRSCGKVYCSICCDKKVQLPSSKDPVRVCDRCKERITQIRTPFAGKLINTLDNDSVPTPPTSNGENIEPAIMGTPLNYSSNSLNIERSVVEGGGNSLQAKLHVQNSDGHSLDGTASGNDLGDATSLDISTQFETAPSSINPAGFDTASLQSCNSTDYGVDPELKKVEAQKSPANNFHISSVDGETRDDGYYIIDAKPKESAFPVGLDSSSSSMQLDVNALASKLASLEVGQLEKLESSTASFMTSPNKENAQYCEVMLGGGEAHKVTVQVEKLGTVVAWEFSTEPKGIAFGISYQANEQQSREEVVLPLRRCMSHKNTLSSEYVAQRAGIYILQFDNCHSKYSGRKLLYKVWKKLPQ